MSVTDRVRLAGLGLHPDRTRALLARWGTAGAVLRGVRLGQIEVSPSIRARLEWDPSRALSEAQARVVPREALPTHLSSLPDAPDVLFVRGVDPTAPGVAIVGTRRATTYGMRLARSFGRAVAEAGWPVVSGLARGIDGAAHVGCLEGGGAGVAVLGNGIGAVYPPEHRSLAGRLLEAGGTVVSEYAPGAPPEPWRFPPRNRIISGLAAVVVVVEAGVKGGALITAARGLEQGRLVLALPGDVDRETSRGCNLLVRDGAHPVLDADDLITSLTFALGPPPGVTSGSADLLLEVVRRDGPMSLEAVAASLDWSAVEVLQRVAKLEALGKVRCESGLVVTADE